MRLFGLFFYSLLYLGLASSWYTGSTSAALAHAATSQLTVPSYNVYRLLQNCMMSKEDVRRRMEVPNLAYPTCMHHNYSSSNIMFSYYSINSCMVGRRDGWDAGSAIREGCGWWRYFPTYCLLGQLSGRADGMRGVFMIMMSIMLMFECVCLFTVWAIIKNYTISYILLYPDPY